MPFRGNKTLDICNAFDHMIQLWNIILMHKSLQKAFSLPSFDVSLSSAFIHVRFKIYFLEVDFCLHQIVLTSDSVVTESSCLPAFLIRIQNY